MGIQTHATLAYGYHLQDANRGWLVKEIHPDDSDKYGPNVDWYDRDEDGEFQEAAMDRLLTAAGFEDVGWEQDRDEWLARRKAADAKVGVEFVSTGYEGGELLLVAKEYRADLGDVKVVDPAELAALSDRTAIQESPDGRLASALRVLGITPLQAEPAWLLTAYRG